MPLSAPRSDLGDLGPSWEGDAEQFAKVREILEAIQNPYYKKDSEERLDALTNYLLMWFRIPSPTTAAEAFHKKIPDGRELVYKKNYDPAMAFALAVLRFALMEDIERFK